MVAPASQTVWCKTKGQPGTRLCVATVQAKVGKGRLGGRGEPGAPSGTEGKSAATCATPLTGLEHLPQHLQSSWHEQGPRKHFLREGCSESSAVTIAAAATSKHVLQQTPL